MRARSSVISASIESGEPKNLKRADMQVKQYKEISVSTWVLFEALWGCGDYV